MSLTSLLLGNTVWICLLLSQAQRNPPETNKIDGLILKSHPLTAFLLIVFLAGRGTGHTLSYTHTHTHTSLSGIDLNEAHTVTFIFHFTKHKALTLLFTEPLLPDCLRSCFY